MLPVWVRIALLGVAFLVHAQLDLRLLEGFVSRELDRYLPTGLLFLPLLLVPLFGLLAGSVSPAVLLVVSALTFPLALMGEPHFTPSLRPVIALGLLSFQVLVLSQLANLCQEQRYSLPRGIGILAALTLLQTTLGIRIPATDDEARILVILALVVGLLATWNSPTTGNGWLALKAFLRRRSAWVFLLGLLGGVFLTVGTWARLPDFHGQAVVLGATVGALLAAWQRNIWRCPGLVPIAGLGLCLALLLMFLLGAESGFLCGFVGLTLGLLFVPLLAAYLWATPAPARPMALAILAGLGLPVAVGASTLALGFGILASLALLFTVLATVVLMSQLFEQLLEILGAILCRIRVAGPGAQGIPCEGPLILVANHSAYFDPIWLCKMMPRKVTAMMTSVFYDLPVVHWLMVHVTQAIRVPAATFRREAPELQEAIGVLQAGGCLLVFPEARLRKSEDKLLFPFGQGLWHILKAVPEAQVMTVWVEGGWGSWTSHANGQPPFRGKPIDCLRRIELGVAAPEPVSSAHLADREAFRLWLMTRVLDCRAHLGLPVPTVEQATGREPTGTTENPHPIDTETDGNR